MKVPKPKRIKDEDYLDYIREQPCMVLLCHLKVDAHHIHSRGSGGSDYSAIPLCRKHHQDYHRLGEREFQRLFYCNVWKEAFLLLEQWVVKKNPWA